MPRPRRALLPQPLDRSEVGEEGGGEEEAAVVGGEDAEGEQEGAVGVRGARPPRPDLLALGL